MQLYEGTLLYISYWSGVLIDTNENYELGIIPQIQIFYDIIKILIINLRFNVGFIVYFRILLMW